MEILVNVTPEEYRVVVVEGGRPVEILVERPEEDAHVGNVYLGRVDKVLPGMQSAFVDVGLARHAFLHVSDADPGVFRPDVVVEGGDSIEDAAASRRAAADRRIEDILVKDQAIVVQVTREPSGAKGARLTRHVSLAGSYLVYLPFSSQVSVSKRIEDDGVRDSLRERLERLRGDAGGVIARTAAASADDDALSRDLAALVAAFRDIEARSRTAQAPACLHAEPALPVRLVRDALASDVTRILVDDEDLRAALAGYLEHHAPALAGAVHCYRGPTPLFEAFGLEQEIERALKDRVWLKSGGTIVINQMEALVAIDVNTGKYTGGRRLEDTVLQTNLEAAREVARQLRLRDLGGIVVVDFIDMAEASHRQQVLHEIESALAKDRAKTTVLGMSEFGLVEITRQRQRRSLQQALTEPCPDCAGTGRIRSALTTANAILRRLRLLGPGSEGREVIARVHPDVAAALRKGEAAARAAGQPLPVRLRVEEDPQRNRVTFDLST